MSTLIQLKELRLSFIQNLFLFYLYLRPLFFVEISFDTQFSYAMLDFLLG